MHTMLEATCTTPQHPGGDPQQQWKAGPPGRWAVGAEGSNVRGKGGDGSCRVVVHVIVLVLELIRLRVVLIVGGFLWLLCRLRVSMV